MSGTTSRLVRAALVLDRSRLQGRDGLRAALGVAVPLLTGIGVDRPLDGAIAAGGAFCAGFAALSSGYRTRVTAALLATAGLAVSTFFGAVVSGTLPLLVLVLGLWGFAAGLLVSLGPAATIVGIQAVIGLLLISPYPMPLTDAAGRGALVAAGGLGQVLLVLLAWPLRRSPVERRAVARAYGSLAAYATGLCDGQAGPPDPRPLDAARAALGDPQPFHRGDSALAFAILTQEAERLRTTLSALAHVRPRLVGAPDRAAAVAAVDALVVEAAALLRDVAAAAVRPSAAARKQALVASSPAADPQRWARLTLLADTVSLQARDAAPARNHLGASLVAELDRLAAGLLASLEAVVSISGAPTAALRTPSPFGRFAVSTLRANLTLRSVAFRHALRLGAVLAVGTAAAQLLTTEQRYWLPLTALVVLKPDFTSTFTRGLGRILGTLVGAVLATGFAAAVEPGPLLLALVIVLTAWAGYAVVFANYAAYGLCVTGFVVFLLAFTGLPSTTTVTDRIEATVLGGGLALVGYAVWPTWERVRLAEQLARLLTAQERYGGALLRMYADPSLRSAETLVELRAAARLARVNAEASVEQARLEPSRRGLSPMLAQGIVAAARRYAFAALSLQSHLPAAGAGPAALGPLADAQAAVFGTLAGILRGDDGPVPLTPLLRGQQAVRTALADCSADDLGAALDVAVLDVEVESMLSAVQEMVGLLRP